MTAFLPLMLLAAASGLPAGQQYSHFSTSTPLKERQFLVLGFMGGLDRWDKENSLRRLALRLRSADGAVQTETVENRKRPLALELIVKAFDRDRDGQLEPDEKASARLILYGQSFGGAAVVKLARQLEKMGIPVLLTVQVDSVGWGDQRIPANVRHAANLFQKNGRVIRGEAPIVAEDPARTTIIGNYEFDYRYKHVDISGVPWHKKLFRVAHNKIEHDRDVWAKVEALILQAIAGL
jgi:hypothetical protein